MICHWFKLYQAFTSGWKCVVLQYVGCIILTGSNEKSGASGTLTSWSEHRILSLRKRNWPGRENQVKKSLPFNQFPVCLMHPNGIVKHNTKPTAGVWVHKANKSVYPLTILSSVHRIEDSSAKNLRRHQNHHQARRLSVAQTFTEKELVLASQIASQSSIVGQQPCSF